MPPSTTRFFAKSRRIFTFTEAQHVPQTLLRPHHRSLPAPLPQSLCNGQRWLYRAPRWRANHRYVYMCPSSCHDLSYPPLPQLPVGGVSISAFAPNCGGRQLAEPCLAWNEPNADFHVLHKWPGSTTDKIHATFTVPSAL